MHLLLRLSECAVYSKWLTLWLWLTTQGTQSSSHFPFSPDDLRTHQNRSVFTPRKDDARNREVNGTLAAASIAHRKGSMQSWDVPSSRWTFGLWSAWVKSLQLAPRTPGQSGAFRKSASRHCTSTSHKRAKEERTKPKAVKEKKRKW